MKAKLQLPENYDKLKPLSLEEAAAMLPKLSTSKFVGNVDVDVQLILSEKQKKESIKGSVVLPHSFGAPKKVVVFADEKDSKIATEAGADMAGLEDLIKQVEDGHADFDVAIATPSVMIKIAKLGRVLGPKGLMPNPSNGTVTSDVAKAVKTYKAGKQDFKMNDQGTIRTKVAKLDMEPAAIVENVKALFKAIYTETKKLNAQPFKKITLSPTMGAAVRLDATKLISEVA